MPDGLVVDMGVLIDDQRAQRSTIVLLLIAVLGMLADGFDFVAPELSIAATSLIRGHALRGSGILRNELYIGELVWNRMRFVRDPATGKRVSRQNLENLWVRQNIEPASSTTRPGWPCGHGSAPSAPPQVP